MRSGFRVEGLEAEVPSNQCSCRGFLSSRESRECTGGFNGSCPINSSSTSKRTDSRARNGKVGYG